MPAHPPALVRAAPGRDDDARVERGVGELAVHGIALGGHAVHEALSKDLAGKAVLITGAVDRHRRGVRSRVRRVRGARRDPLQREPRRGGGARGGDRAPGPSTVGGDFVAPGVARERRRRTAAWRRLGAARRARQQRGRSRQAGADRRSHRGVLRRGHRPQRALARHGQRRGAAAPQGCAGGGSIINVTSIAARNGGGERRDDVRGGEGLRQRRSRAASRRRS